MKRQSVLEWQASHGGVRQRRAAATASGPAGEFRPYSKLVEVCLDVWTYEELDAIKLQKYKCCKGGCGRPGFTAVDSR